MPGRGLETCPCYKNPSQNADRDKEHSMRGIVCSSCAYKKPPSTYLGVQVAWMDTRYRQAIALSSPWGRRAERDRHGYEHGVGHHELVDHRRDGLAYFQLFQCQCLDCLIIEYNRPYSPRKFAMAHDGF
jgi:hypothetical protein